MGINNYNPWVAILEDDELLQLANKKMERKRKKAIKDNGFEEDGKEAKSITNKEDILRNELRLPILEISERQKPIDLTEFLYALQKRVRRLEFALGISCVSICTMVLLRFIFI